MDALGNASNFAPLIAGGFILLALLVIFLLSRSPEASTKKRVQTEKARLIAKGELPIVAAHRARQATKRPKKGYINPHTRDEDDVYWQD